MPIEARSSNLEDRIAGHRQAWRLIAAIERGELRRAHRILVTVLRDNTEMIDLMVEYYQEADQMDSLKRRALQLQGPPTT